MAGLCGYLNFEPSAGTSALLTDMLAKLDADGARGATRYADPAGRFGLGAVSLGIVSTASQPARSNDGRLLAIVDGELYDMASLGSDLRGGGPEIAADDFAAALLRLYLEEGPAAVCRLEGSFAAAVVDVNNATLTLFADGFGTRPIYYAQTGTRFVFASRIAAILADADVPHAFDWSGLSQFFTFGHYLNDDTSLCDVKILPAGSALTFNANTKLAQILGHWTGAERVGQVSANRREAFDQVDEAFHAAVRKRSAANGSGIGLALSGGLDARTILGVFEEPATRLKTVCLGMAGSRDHQASQALAAIAGCPHRSHLLDEAFLADFGRHLKRMVQLTDGQYLSQCIVMPTFSVYQELGIGVLLRGHGGELLHLSKAYNYSVDAAAMRLANETELNAWLWSGLQAYLLDGVDRPLFADRGVDRAELARTSLKSAIARTPADRPPVDRISHLFLDQRLRRETPLSLMKFRSVVEPRMPYMDRAVMERVLAIPAAWKLDDELQTHILQKRRPRFCDVENTNTGAALGVGKLRRKAIGLKMKVLSKLGMPGYQPYERLGLWLRRELAPLVQQTLLDEACLDRGIFDPDTVRSVVARHLSGERNHTYLIMAMMVFEVGHRELFGERAFQHGIGRRQQPVAV
jgi:asparagine synthase (glutamine-hydrolysing)